MDEVTRFRRREKRAEVAYCDAGHCRNRGYTPRTRTVLGGVFLCEFCLAIGLEGFFDLFADRVSAKDVLLSLGPRLETMSLAELLQHLRYLSECAVARDIPRRIKETKKKIKKLGQIFPLTEQKKYQLRSLISFKHELEERWRLRAAMKMIGKS